MKISIIIILLTGLAAAQVGAEPIALRSLRFEPPENPLSYIPEEFAVTESTREVDYYLVQLTRVPDDGLIAALTRGGITIIDYIPFNAYLVRADEQTLSRLATEGVVQWWGLWQPYFKIEPYLLSAPDEEKLDLFVQVFPLEPTAAVKRVLEQQGAWVVAEVGGPQAKLRVQVASSHLEEFLKAAARESAVSWIERYPHYTLCNDRTVWVCQSGLYAGQTTPLWTNGVYGQGEYVAILDTGCDADMCFFYDQSQGLPGAPNPFQRKIYSYQDIYSSNNWDQVDHGTHVAGTVAGDNFANPLIHDPGDGIAPGAKLVVQDAGVPGDVQPPDDMYGTLQAAYQHLARVHSNSWGWPGTAGQYHTHSQEVDRFTWEYPDFLVVFAMGNEGPTSGTMRAPGTAKNCVSVGATEAGSAAENNASFSSHGPTDDGRMKPDITMPGSSIVSAANDNSGSSYNCGTTSMSGTSMATPGVAGACALIRSYYAQGFYPTGVSYPDNAFNPSAALVKATLINSGVNMTGSYTANSGSGHADIPSFGQGWGRILLDGALYFPGDTRDLYLDDHTTGLTTGQSVQYSIAITSGSEPFEATLVWSDYPSNPSAALNLVNDLDLTVTTNGVTYKGNVYSGGQSVAGGTKDSLNNVECVQLNTPSAGLFQITITAAAVPQGPQPFALVVTGDIAFSDGIISLTRDRFGCNDQVGVRLSDYDLQGITATVVTVSSDSEPSGEAVTLTEVQPDSGVFQGQIETTAQGPHEGKVLVAEGDTLRAVYVDEDDGHGGFNIEKVDTAAIDCTPPTITNVEVVRLTGVSAVIRWITNEPATGSVTYGTSVPPTEVADSGTLATIQEVTLSELTEDTGYIFMVTSCDEANNLIIDDNNGDYFFFHTLRTVTAFLDDMEMNPSWTQQGDGQWEWTQPRGLGGSFLTNPDPNFDHTSGMGKVRGTDLTQDGLYNAMSNSILVSPEINCSTVTAAQLELWHWLNLSSDMMFQDCVYLEISTNNGATWTEVWAHESGYTTDEWEMLSIDISEYADEQASVKLRFRLTSGAIFEDSGWNLDDLRVWGYDTGATYPTPTPRPTRTPTLTPTPTRTVAPGSPTFTPVPSFTPSPSGTPATATPEPSSTPQPTTTPELTATPYLSPTPGIECCLAMVLNDTLFAPGEQVQISAHLWNLGTGLRADVYIVLDVAGGYWFWPTWISLPDLDYETMYMYHQYDEWLTILDFVWPNGAGSYRGAYFWGFLTHSGGFELVCEPSVVEFGWEE